MSANGTNGTQRQRHESSHADWSNESPLVRDHASVLLLGCAAAARLDPDRVHAGAAGRGAAVESDAQRCLTFRRWARSPAIRPLKWCRPD